MTEQSDIDVLRALIASGDTASVRAALMQPLEQPGGAGWLRTLDAAGLLTQLMPELEVARNTGQPSAHALPVLGHMLEAATAIDWLLRELYADARRPPPDDRRPSTSPPTSDTLTQNSTSKTQNLPLALQAHPELRWPTRHADAFRAHMATRPAGAWTRGALLKLAALLHDNGKPATKQVYPNGTVSFHEHQLVGARTAEEIARRLGFAPPEVDYLRLIVKEHMRPGQLNDNPPITSRAVQRFFHATHDAGPDLLLHSMADHLATRGPRTSVEGWYRHVQWTDALLDTIWGATEEETPPLLDGHQLMQTLGLQPGPLIGRLLASVGEAQANGDITTTEEALALARRLFEGLGTRG